MQVFRALDYTYKMRHEKKTPYLIHHYIKKNKRRILTMKVAVRTFSIKSTDRDMALHMYTTLELTYRYIPKVPEYKK